MKNKKQIRMDTPPPGLRVQLVDFRRKEYLQEVSLEIKSK